MPAPGGEVPADAPPPPDAPVPAPVPPADGPGGETEPAPGDQGTEEERLEEIDAERAAKLAAAEEAERLRAEKAAELAHAARIANEQHLRRLGRITLWGFLAVIVVVMAVGLVGLGEVREGIWAIFGTPADVLGRLKEPKHALLLAAIAALILWIVLAVLSFAKRESGRLTGMLIGQDGRFSTSYFQAWVWTVVVVWAFLFFVLLAAIGGPALDLGGDSLISVNPDYLLLLGGPYAALLIAMQIDQSKVAAGELQKVTASETTVTDLYSTDSGRTDLVDTQYLLFNAVALVFFFGAMIADHRALPDIPDQLIVLTSGAALGYVAGKAIKRNAPVITSIVPAGGLSVATTGHRVIISGRNFVPAGAEAAEALTQLRVKFGAVVVAPVLPEGDLTDRQIAVLRRSLTAEVPDLSGDGHTERSVDVVVVTASDIETPAFGLRVYSPVLRARLEPVEVTDGTARIRIKLLDRTKADALVRVTVGTTAYDVLWTDGYATVEVPEATADGAALSVTSAGATWKGQVSLPAAV